MTQFAFVRYLLRELNPEYKLLTIRYSDHKCMDQALELTAYAGLHFQKSDNLFSFPRPAIPYKHSR